LAPWPEGCSRKQLRLLAAYRDEAFLRYGERTAEGYCRYLGRFVAWLLDRGVEAGQARSEDLQAYQAALCGTRTREGRPLSVGSQINHLHALRSFYRFLYRRSMVLQDPSAALRLPGQGERLPREILSVREVRRLIAHTDTRMPHGLRDRALLETLYATGIRISELTKLKLEDVDLEERVLHVLLGKGRKDRFVPLTSAASDAIEAYLVAARPRLLSGRARRELFVGNEGGRLTGTPVTHILRACATRAGVKKRVTCHVFRHSVATHLLRGGADIRHVQELLGHASLATTERYTRVEVQDLRRVIERAHPRGR
jgi:integrase/recombinase XerD